MTISQTDESYMRTALSLALKGEGRTSPNPMVGAVIVAGDKMIGQGLHEGPGEPHAEIGALAEAGDQARGATLYVNMEPCCHHGRTPPCTGAVIRGGLKRVVVGALDPSDKVSGKGVAELREAGIEVEVGALEVECRRLNEFFNVFHEAGRPFVTIKWAMTADGRTGTDSNHSRWISNEASRRYVHQMRSLHDAILVGIGTVLADDPMLNVRLDDYAGRQPMRVIVDGDLSIPRRARVLRERGGGKVIIVTTQYAPEKLRTALQEDGHRVVVLPGRRRLIRMETLLEFLAGEKILSVFCEGGRQIETSLIQAGLADKLFAFIAPKIVGGRALRSPVEDLSLTSMEDAIRVRRPRWIPFGDDICLEGYLRDL